MSDGSTKDLGFNAAWAMAVGGMIGGGIFATLGVVIQVAGQWAWASFVIGGLIALATGHSYAALTSNYGKSGGSYRFFREMGLERTARFSAWLLIVGYTLTCAVYAFTFGAYLGHAIGGPSWLPHAMAATAIILLAGVNLAGVGKAAALEIAVVWGKLAILAGLAIYGLSQWEPARLAVEQPPGMIGAIIGAAIVFMAYEGFELLSYDYDDMRDGKSLIGRVTIAAIATAIAVYVAVALGVPMLTDTATIIQDGEVALAMAGQAAFGLAGLILVTIAAAFSTASAINATLFSTARLARDVAKEGEFPAIFEKTDSSGVPYFGIVAIAGAALALTLIGGLTDLITGASVVFLVIFGSVNLIAWRKRIAHPLISLFGTIGAFAATITLILYLAGLI